MNINREASLSPSANALFDQLSKLPCIKDYCLIGGTALALQIAHRKSEDLDFCIWKNPLQSLSSIFRIDVPTIEKELSTIGKVQKDWLDSYHCDFVVNDVKLTFFHQNKKEPIYLKKEPVCNNLVVADPISIGAMKIAVFLYRNTFRDYYDIYSLLREGVPLQTMIERALHDTRHQLRTRDVYAMLSNARYFAEDKRFPSLAPKYDVSAEDIEKYMVEQIKSLAEKKEQNKGFKM